MTLRIYRPDLAEVPKRTIGLGDLVKEVLAPAIKGCDTLLGTNLASCRGCKARAEKLNAIVPDIRHPLSGG